MYKRLNFKKDDICNGFIFVEYCESKGGRCMGLWICPICEQPFVVANTRINNAIIKSCGCQTSNRFKKEIKENPDYCWNVLFSIVKRNAEVNKYQINISPEYLKSIYEQQNGKCFYTKKEIRPPKCLIDKKSIDIISVDRIDSDLGYVEGNIQFVIKDVNYMKGYLSHQEFINLCTLIANRFEK